MIAMVKLQGQYIMIELKGIDRKWYIIDKETLELKLREDAPYDVKKTFNENIKAINALEKHIYRNFGKNKKEQKEMKKMKSFGNNNVKTMFDSEGNMHMISGEGDIKYDSFTGRFFNDIGPGSLKQDPVTGDMWFDNGNFMDVNLQTYHLLKISLF